MPDILDQIDAVLADVSSCAFCQSPLRDQGPSQDFCGEVCQWNWYERQGRVKGGIEKRAVAPEAAVEPPAMGERQFREAFAEIAAERGNLRPFLTMALDSEADAFAERVSAALDELEAVTITRADLTGHIDDPACTCFRCHPEWHTGVRCNCAHCVAVAAAVLLPAAAWQPARPGDTPGELVPGEADIPRPVDAALQPEPDEPVDVHRYECPHSDCDWTKVALDRDVLLDLAEAHELQTHAPRSWWRRMLPGGQR